MQLRWQGRAFIYRTNAQAKDLWIVRVSRVKMRTAGATKHLIASISALGGFNIMFGAARHLNILRHRRHNCAVGRARHFLAIVAVAGQNLCWINGGGKADGFTVTCSMNVHFDSSFLPW